MATTDNKKTLWIVLITALLIAGIVLLIRYNLKSEKETYFNKIELVNPSIIVNRTDMKYLDTVVSVGLEELDIRNVFVIIRNQSRDNDKDGYVFKALIRAGKSPSNQYLIEIDESTKSDIIESISHELIHLKQYHTKKLTIDTNYLVWKGDTIRHIIPYEDREWEQEAFGLGRVLEIQIRSILYK